MKPLKSIFFGLLFFLSATLSAQNIYIYPEQPLQFGAFTVAAAGGTVTVSAAGERTSSGTIQLLNSEHHPAVFTISTDHPTPIEVIVEVSREPLINSDGTAMLMASISPAEETYILQAGKPVQVKVGATIQLNSGANSAGEFQGNVSINVIPNSE
ncbi:MAG TPA: DUF4402 domain-containing protein [Salinimicrobium catena]|uniref:DUF4402 domain-containing protein n=1 Tax=Salinimicrobium catena TaxID=390640 RepID=A0A7C2M884_9FLAO|nr:DUF4402 domain-containing protein [Salinimicrobium catena]